jgi:hypothetical protein
VEEWFPGAAAIRAGPSCYSFTGLLHLGYEGAQLLDLVKLLRTGELCATWADVDIALVVDEVGATEVKAGGDGSVSTSGII